MSGHLAHIMHLRSTAIVNKIMILLSNQHQSGLKSYYKDLTTQETSLLIIINFGSKGIQYCGMFYTVYKHKILTYIATAVSYQFTITLLFMK